MPIVPTFITTPEFYCPVCGHKYESKIRYANILPQPITLGQKIITLILEKVTDSKTRYINIECIQCRAKLVYDTQKGIIKIKK